jgi:hypothetical protein
LLLKSALIPENHVQTHQTSYKLNLWDICQIPSPAGLCLATSAEGLGSRPQGAEWEVIDRNLEVAKTNLVLFEVFGFTQFTAFN